MERFKKITRIEKGNFGEVWLAKDTYLARDVALKIIPKKKCLKEGDFFREAKILKGLSHKNLLKVLDADFYDEDHIYLATEYLPKGSLEAQRKGRPIHMTRAKSIMIGVMRALEVLHINKILHRDIKPSNILIGEHKTPKLGDFGLSMNLGKTFEEEEINDYWYFPHKPPESFGKSKDYEIPGEIYACGVTLYRLVNGDINLEPLPKNLKEMIQTGKFPPRNKYLPFVPSQLISVINKALKTNPNQRFQTIFEMRVALEQTPIERNWSQEETSKGDCEWISVKEKKVFLLRCFQNRKGWEIHFLQGPSRKSLKKIKKLCFVGLTKTQAFSKSSKILKRVASGASPLQITL